MNETKFRVHLNLIQNIMSISYDEEYIETIEIRSMDDAEEYISGWVDTPRLIPTVITDFYEVWSNVGPFWS